MKGSHDVSSSVLVCGSTVSADRVVELASLRNWFSMIHYTCDRCKREIDTTHQTRHVVQIEIKAIVGSLAEDFEDEVDHLSELNQLLEGIGDDPSAGDLSETCHRGRYDLCPECHRQFVRNPLGRDAMAAFGFSNN